MTLNRPRLVIATEAKAWLGDGGEIALLDVREAGEFAAGHPLFASSAPLGVFEARLVALVPRRSCRLVLFDDGRSGRAERGAAAAAELGYERVFSLEGGVGGWTDAGFALFEGVNVPSKAFGELAEHVFGVRHLAPRELARWMRDGQPVLVLDGRPPEEHRRMNIPGSICLPNGEMAARIETILPEPSTPIVVHCAGRTRSIIGAQILRDLGLPNPVFALENGTQGWALAGLELEHGSSRRVHGRANRARSTRGIERAAAWGVPLVDAQRLSAWAADPDRTTYCFDVRSAEEFAEGHIPGAVHAPGGQLIQAIDHWAAVRGAKIVLVDDDLLRAVVVARWLRLMGWECAVLAGGKDACADVRLPAPEILDLPLPPKVMPAPDGRVLILDTRSSTAFRAGHIAGARWTLRCHLETRLADVEHERPIALCGDDETVLGLVTKDLRRLGYSRLSVVPGGPTEGRTAGLPVVATPSEPSDAEAIDFAFFAHDRHSGNLDAARQYLAWETGLTARLDASERAVFKL